MTISFYWQKLVHATEYHLQKKIANIIYRGILKQDDWIEITVVSPCEHSLLWSSWVGSKKAALLESCQTFEVAAAQTSGPVNLVLSLQTGFFECSIHLFEFIEKPMVTTKTSVASARLLGLGSKLYPSDMLRMFNKDLSQFMQSLYFQVCQNQARLIKASAGCKVL